MPSVAMQPTNARTPVGINGFGRIGRAVFRASLNRDDLDVVAINHTAPNLKTLLYSIHYDSTHGRLAQAAELTLDEASNSLVFRGRKIALFSERDPLKLDWASVGAEYIVEATGKMLTTPTASQHLRAGAKKVVISAPAKDAETKTIVVGVNRKEYRPEMQVLSNASCTTNCLAPLAKVLHDEFGIESGMMTTVHASTSSQPILDGFSKKSVRLGRGVGHNIIPTTTGASKAVALVLPELAGKFAGLSVRVPTNNVSMVDLTVRLERPAESKEALLHPLREAAAGRRKWSIAPLSNVIAVCDEELVSHDFLGREESCIVDVAATLMLDPHTFKVIAWYDNEYAYSVRCLDLVKYMHTVDNGLTSGASTPFGNSAPQSLSALVSA
ncbi:putative Glyceraldehyde-3-phosphate dehydrogenase (phosphorylating) [Rhodotorula taiwanensis]|uniref:Glyceraldehyde-3-phosphate dehydrogenase n=1 Tax=Rhodotorula taiwanensis TaxID=741276 RepID=A0A2S5BBS2_9BASI|nr:putative Glyceraldehyde-3-phosphate dehydrogenase (phosphorylating) [Rhodotorula taiwanensis]